MLCGLIHEFPGALDHPTHLSPEAILVREGDRVRRLSASGDAATVAEVKELSAFAIAGDALWIEHFKKPAVPSSFACFAVSLATGKRLSRSKHPLAEATFLDEKCAFIYWHGSIDDPFRLRVVDRASDRLLGEVDVPAGGMFALPQGIYGQGQSTVWGATWEPTLTWSRAFDTQVSTFGAVLPVLLHGLVIAVLGVTAADRRHGLMVALDASTGKTVWELTTPAPQGSLRIEGDHVLAIAGGRILRIEAKSGRVVLDADSGFDHDGLAQTVQPLGDGLVAIAPRESRLRIYSHDAKTVVQELRLPDAHMLRDDKPLVPVGDGHCVLTSSKTMYPVSHGALVLREWDDSQPEGIVVPPWPVESVVLRMGVKKGKEEYLHMGIRDGSLEDVLRYGEIALQSRLNAETLHMWQDEKKSRFNGKILFSCDAADGGKGAEARVAAMIERVNGWSRESDMTAPSDRKTIAQVELVPMSEFERKAPPG